MSVTPEPLMGFQKKSLRGSVNICLSGVVSGCGQNSDNIHYIMQYEKTAFFRFFSSNSRLFSPD
jgi:hypothetical protein